jgi:thiol-disulfide isomerase/thioredoxin
MRRTLPAALLVAVAASGLWADDKPAAKPAPTSEQFDALKKECEEALKAFSESMNAAQEETLQAIKDAKTDDEKKDLQKKLMAKMSDGPGPKFSGRFLAFAEANPKDPAAIDALVMALRTSGGPQAKSGAWSKTMTRLQENYVANPEVKRVARMLAGVNDEGADKFLKEVVAKNADRKTQAIACKSLQKGRENAAAMAERIKGNELFRGQVEERNGKQYVEHVLADADKARDDAKELEKTIKDKYADVFPDLSVGKPAPEVVSQNLDGKPVKLSDLKGKVVVLDIWATWCGPCRQMIPHSKEMVEKLKDKPFTLVSISADAEKKTLTDFIEKTPMPWTHWWNGAEGGILEDWDVQYFPTIYVIDAKGVIRHKDLRGEELETAVNELLNGGGEGKAK